MIKIKQLLSIIFLMGIFFAYGQTPDPQEFFAPLKLKYIPLAIGSDSIIVSSDGILSHVLKSELDQQLSISGTNIIIDGDGGNSIDISALVSPNSVWGAITGSISNQTDLQSIIDGKQETLVSATNIRTLNGQDLLGSGDIVIDTGGTITSVNGDVGPIVVLDADNIDDTSTTNKFVTDAQIADIATSLGWGDHSIVGYSTGAHTLDTNTQLSDAQVSAAMLSEHPLIDLDSTDDLSAVTFSIIGGSPSDNTNLLNALNLKANDAEVIKEDVNSPISGITLALGTTAQLDAMPTPADIEVATDQDSATDYHVNTIAVTGTVTKTITLAMNGGLPDVTTTFTDDGAGGAGDGNDFLTTVTESGGIMTFGVQNQTNPTWNIDTFLGTYNYSTGAHTVDTDTQLNESQVDAFVSNNGFSLGAHTIDTNTQLSQEQVQDYVGPMVTGNTESGIAVTYDDPNNQFDFTVNAGSANIVDNSIAAIDIATSGVATAEILNGTIIAEDLATSSVTGTKILNNTITTDDIATSGVATAEILNGTIIAEDIASSAITSSKIADGSILNVDLAANSIDTDNYRDDSITSAHISTNSVNNDGLAPLAVQLGNLNATGATTVGRVLAIASPTSFVWTDLETSGTFSPVLAASSGSYTYTVTKAVYVKTGKIVNFNMYFSLISTNTASGSTTITGMPFQANGQSQFSVLIDATAPNFYSIVGRINDNTTITTLLIQSGFDGGNSSGGLFQFNGTGTLGISGSYITD